MLSAILGLSQDKLSTILGPTHTIGNTQLLSPEALERTARANWDELRQLPPAFRAPALMAQVAANASSIGELTD